MGIGDDYQEQTKYSRDTLGGGLRYDEREGPYKYYENPIERIDLPEPETSGGAGLWDIMAARRSGRRYADTPMPLKTLSQLLWAMNGITSRTRDFDFRTTPSAGALYPVETYLVANRVKDLDWGVYHHDVRKNRLDYLSEGFAGDAVARAALGQAMCSRSAVTFIWTAIPARSKWKYRERAYRYIYIDAGHIGQGLTLAAEAMGLACCMIGAFFDEELNAVVGVDGKTETSIYLAAVGAKP